MKTFAVTNLYSNIPHKSRKQAISFWILKYPEALQPRFNLKIITDGIELILDISYQFDHISFIQTLGTSMGTKMAPTYATLTWAYIEENQYEIIGKNKVIIQK